MLVPLSFEALATHNLCKFFYYVFFFAKSYAVLSRLQTLNLKKLKEIIDRFYAETLLLLFLLLLPLVVVCELYWGWGGLVECFMLRTKVCKLLFISRVAHTIHLHSIVLSQLCKTFSCMLYLALLVLFF